MIVTGRIPGHLCVLIMDITQNVRGFEHDLSKRLTAQIQALGLTTTPESPVLVQGNEEFRTKLSSSKFNCLLLVGHGGPDPGDGRVSAVGGPQGRTDWYTLAELSENLQDKLLMLCVCHGFCADVVEAFVTRDSLCMSTLAPTDTLHANEAEAFFPNFLRELNKPTPSGLDPNDIQRALASTKQLSNGKMRLYSQGLSSPD